MDSAQDDKNRDRDDSKTESVGSASCGSADHPDRIGSFRIESLIDSGGMGTVYRAFDESVKRTVALKVLHPSLEISSNSVSRFAREAWIAGQLEHERIVRVYGRGEDDQRKYIVMEYVDGGSLADYIAGKRHELETHNQLSDTINREYIAAILHQFVALAKSLNYIHEKGFIHRDIKPHNILISGKQKQFKFSDFGIAHAADMPSLTRAGDFIGTVKYMSPELLTAHRAEVDHRTDIYSLGVTLYEALTLQSPYHGDSEEKFIGEIISGHVIPARQRNKRLSREVETVLLKATHHDRSLRYDSASEFAEDVENILENRPIKAARPSLLQRSIKFVRRRRSLVLAAGVTMVATLCIVYALSGWLQGLEDRQLIRRTLETAAELKQTPFYLEPDWPRLSSELYSELIKDESDSLVIWLYRVSSTFDYRYLEYSVFEHARIDVVQKGIDVFDTTTVPEAHFGVVMSYVEVAIDGGNYMDFGGMVSLIGTHPSPKTSVGYHLENYKTDLAEGEHAVNVRVVTEYYHGAIPYEPYDPAKHISPDMSWDDLKSDRLVALTARAGNIRDVVLLDTDSIPVVGPLVVDTSDQVFRMWIFHEFPEGFPRAITTDEHRRTLDSAFKLDSATIVDISIYGESSLSLKLFGSVRTRIIPPIAGQLVVREFSTEELLVTGDIRIAQGDIEFHLKDLPFTRWHGSWTEQGEDLILLNGFGLGEPFLEEEREAMHRVHKLIGAHGEGEAIIEIIPSIEVARGCGNVREFWGDTLVFRVPLRTARFSLP